MAWNKPTAEEVIGMTSDDLKKKLDSAATKDDLTEALKPVEEFKTSLESIKASLAALTVPKETPPELVDDGDPAVKMLANPKKFVADEMAPYRQSQLETQAQLSEMRARQNPEFAGAFREYGTELVEMANKMPLETRTQPNFWPWHIRTILGDKLITGKLKQNFPSLLGTSSVVRGADGEIEDPNFGFDGEMAAFFRNRGKDLKDMAFLRDRMVRDGDTLTEKAWKERPH